MRMQLQNKLIKPKRFKRQPKHPVNVIKTFNQFESLPIEECNMAEVENNTQEKYDVTDIETDQKKIGITKKLKLTKFFDNNPFEVLMDNHEEGIKNIITRNVILNTPKHCLKKCKRCNFKKRTCVFDSSSCKAVQQCCFKCKKKGHYPQSPYCEAKKRSKFTQETNMKTERIIPNIFDRNMLQLVAIKINQLESASEKNLSASFSDESDSCNTTENIIPDNLIPFLVMFICLNYDSRVSPVNKWTRKEKNSKQSIVKAADYCARKFKKMQYDPQYF